MGPGETGGRSGGYGAKNKEQDQQVPGARGAGERDGKGETEPENAGRNQFAARRSEDHTAGYVTVN